MKRRFVVCVDLASKEQQDILTRFFREQGVGFWHWFNDLWLVTDSSNNWSTENIRNKVQGLMPGVPTMVIEVGPNTSWSGFGRKEHFEWLHKEWDN